MKHKIPARKDMEMGKLSPSDKKFLSLFWKKNAPGYETFYLHKIGIVLDPYTSFEYKDESDILQITYTDGHTDGMSMSKPVDVSKFGFTIKEIVADIEYIINDCKYRAANGIESTN